MPSIGAVRAMIVSQRIDKGIKENFSGEEQKDAYKFFDLSSKGGDIGNIVIVSIFGVFLTFIISCLGLLTGIVTGAFSLAMLYWAIRRRKKARRDLDDLVASNREYWLPIGAKLRQIVLNAGKLDGMQLTRLVH